ncbi:hypothetical protein HETIRDRAFT_471689 [Heterobasidion irregulare TC 32-1]|uniref:Uncharacterized protein n=1 Tax=Heterobasidion irregulare (strain TC 32-1) TaxID=747525 RepID=W4KKE0_HETIT|nr:uncharacterized protein HETIRDRAFT_471689 [Heterobasidion irregulare TC 32-1]ETW86303.1 hypothetical protein HETIRDRAFT_471689 [Heterobasidion irregulare TC 32-1]
MEEDQNEHINNYYLERNAIIGDSYGAVGPSGSTPTSTPLRLPTQGACLRVCSCQPPARVASRSRPPSERNNKKSNPICHGVLL